VADRRDVVVGVDQPGVLRRAVDDTTAAISRRHGQFESVIDAPPDDGASTAPGHEAAPVRCRQISQEDRFLTAVERLASPPPQLVTVVVIEPEDLAAIRRDRIDAIDVAKCAGTARSPHDGASRFPNTRSPLSRTLNV
jgi:hypothetical protein